MKKTLTRFTLLAAALLMLSATTLLSHGGRPMVELELDGLEGQ